MYQIININGPDIYIYIYIYTYIYISFTPLGLCQPLRRALLGYAPPPPGPLRAPAGSSCAPRELRWLTCFVGRQVGWLARRRIEVGQQTSGVWWGACGLGSRSLWWKGPLRRPPHLPPFHARPCVPARTVWPPAGRALGYAGKRGTSGALSGVVPVHMWLCAGGSGGAYESGSG